MDNRVNLYGANGSPYSCKIRAYLRYKRIPFNWKSPFTSSQGFGSWNPKFKEIKPRVIPIIEFADGSFMNESTKIIDRVEKEYQNRSVRPWNRCNAFICDLLEDFADEWCTKLMYGMRWNRKIDQEFGSLFIAQYAPQTMVKYIAQQMSKRQVPRTKLVGCDDDNEIHQSLHEICSIFEKYLSEQNNVFLFGNYPTNADFAFYGQMSQFRVDMTPNKILRDKYPFLFSWVYKMDDLSGIQMETNRPKFQISDIVKQLLCVCGNIYLPFLKANRDALLKKKDTFSVDIMINNQQFRHTQKPFKWQAKCFKILQQKLHLLRYQKDFKQLKQLLMDCNCWNILSDNNMLRAKHSKL